MGYVGFANLPNQVHRKSARKVSSELGLGKSTLINTPFNTNLYPPKKPLPPAAERPKTVAIESIGAGEFRVVSRSFFCSLSLSRVDIPENGVHLTFVDTPGFADILEGHRENIESRFDSYLEQENRVSRLEGVDNRVHACLYFINRLGTRSRIFSLSPPLLKRADTMTEEEVADFKEPGGLLLSDIAHPSIHIFQAPTYDNEDEETIAEAEEIGSKIPFAVVGSDKVVVSLDGREGVVEVDNEEHCDFVKLRQMLNEGWYSIVENAARQPSRRFLSRRQVIRDGCVDNETFQGGSRAFPQCREKDSHASMVVDLKSQTFPLVCGFQQARYMLSDHEMSPKLGLV
ncbi:Septin-domain-containing protein [Mycena metata]|uniref:Septin-domain-containing protein n=1 Tax=Mycena metata TaxID=1033252 RepID=A0AAD7MSJ7_9AGAR|nr:Septin-domain-containing protein [Mycena metata]